MSTKQRVKVSTAKLLARVTRQRDELHNLAQVSQAKRDGEIAREKLAKITELEKAAEFVAHMTLEEYAASSYASYVIRDHNDGRLEAANRVVHMLEMATEDVITVDTDSDLGSYL